MAPGYFTPSGLPVMTSQIPSVSSMLVHRRRLYIDGGSYEYLKMAKTTSSAPSTSSSRDQHQQPRSTTIGRMKYSYQQASSSASSSMATITPLPPLPQCKVKRNYACSKCSYYTQNPRSFLHHQKNIHAERLRVYECSQCLYASKHSQKLQRHVQMVHNANAKYFKKLTGILRNDKSRPLLVPPVRIRMQRTEKPAAEHLGELVIVEDVDVDDNEMEEEIEVKAEDNNEEVEEEVVGSYDTSMEDQNDLVGESSSQIIEYSPPTASIIPIPLTSVPVSQQLTKKTVKPEKQPSNFIRCSVCPFGSHSQILVNRHEKTAHLKKKFYRCMKCNYVTHMRARYTKHVKYHTMPMIKCDDCDFRTPYKWNLDRHNRNHSNTSQGTYKCSHCSFSADIKQSLTVHETNHHVPPVGGAVPTTLPGRRRYRVGASDAPGSAVDGTEIVTYETANKSGIVEIMTETKNAMSAASANGGSSSKITAALDTSNNSNSSNSNSGGNPVVMKTTTVTSTISADAVTMVPPAGVKIISVLNPNIESVGAVSVNEEKTPSRRRPMPKLIPIVEQQQKSVPPMIVRVRKPASPPAETLHITTVTADDNDYYNVTSGESALGDFASLIDEQYDQDNVGATLGNSNCSNTSTSTSNSAATSTAIDRHQSGSSTGSSTSPKSKIASFFDKLKAKVDETADLTCSVCRYESKCLSEFMRHQRMHDDENDDDPATRHIVVIDKSEMMPTPLPPLPVKAAELKSTRCQRCRKRCKTSTELVVHLATCRGASTATNASVINVNLSDTGLKDENETINEEMHNKDMHNEDIDMHNEDVDIHNEDKDIHNEDIDMHNEELQQDQHPMENKIFVWNTAAVSTAQDEYDGEEHSVTLTKIVTPAEVSEIKPELDEEEEDHDDDDEEEEDEDDDEDVDEEEQHEERYTPTEDTYSLLQQQYQQCISRKEGKIYKTVFKCPHCTFWAATASRFHVHIVGHLNRKPFECSCCAYRSNWRWDITKHIRLKSAKRFEDESVTTNSHHGAKVLMTDETGRRNYSKYNRYLTVMEMDITDSTDRSVGGIYDDGKGITIRATVGGMPVRKRRAIGSALRVPVHFKDQLSGKMASTTDRVPSKKLRVWTDKGQQHIRNNPVKPPSPSYSIDGIIENNRSKTVWKCKKCFFRDCDRLTVLNHVKAHYRRGEFGDSSNGSTPPSSTKSYGHVRENSTVTNNRHCIQKNDKAESSNITVEKARMISDLHRKVKIPMTGTTVINSLQISTNPKSFMLYDDENFLSCPLCDVISDSPEKFKEHMESAHVSEETKYRCEYCPFWSEDKKVMLDHVVYSHEVDDRITNVNATDVSHRTEQRDESISNDEELGEITGSSNDTTNKMELFDNGSDDDTTNTTNMEVVFETSDENMVVVETIECKPDFDDNDSTMQTTPSKDSEKSGYGTDDKNNHIMISCEYDGGEERDDDEQVEDEEIIVRAEEATKSSGLNVKIDTVVTTKAATEDNSTVPEGKNQIYECNECWYFSTNKKDVHSHKELHVKRGALYNCTQCVFNVTKASVLYHHYRYGHMIEEPELRYPEDSVVLTGYRDINVKNIEKQLEGKTIDAVDVNETGGPPLVWFYNKKSHPSFIKVYKCRYCPHTNRRRHNTIEHERMHSDHPNHQNHRQQQQNKSGCLPPLSPLHPCKRCTYVCNNGGVLASHLKVHMTSYGCSVVGFCDSSIVDSMQVQALEYVMELEQNLLTDESCNNYCKQSPSDCDHSSESTDVDNQEDTKYEELDDPELKFCPYCPARFFFRYDLQCHIQFHKFRGWQHACDCCSFSARTSSHITAHEIVHCDEYAQRTTELLSSGYPVSQRYSRPSEYPASVSGGSSPRPQQRSPQETVKYEVEETASNSSEERQQRRAKRLQNSDTDAIAIPPPSIEKQECTENITKRRRRSTTTAETSKTSTNTAPPSPPKTAVAMKTCTSATVPKTPAPEANPLALKSTSGAVVKPSNISKSGYVKPFTCDLCPGHFFKAIALQYHKTLHGGPGRHKCRKCNYAVSTYGNLIRHESIHVDLPPREKVKTGISFKAASKKNNVAKSTGYVNPETEMPPPPPPADNSSSLAMKMVGDNNEFPIDPEFGPSMLGNPNFYYPTTVKNGVIRQKRYKCIKCPTAFDKREQYVVHLTLHGAGDKYTCDKCDYSVRYPANYQQHQRKHARDAEIRKNIAQEASRLKMIEEQEAASRAPRGHHRLAPPPKEPSPPAYTDPREIEFHNEISDRQTAYELNTAYGATGIVGTEMGDVALFCCTMCPYECDSRGQLDVHETHHQEFPEIRRSSAAGSASKVPKRSWRRACRFCTYRTQTEADLASHTRVHFLRSTGVTLATMTALATSKPDKNDVIEPTDQVEMHGKRVVYNQDGSSDDGDNVITAEDAEPFFIFKDAGAKYVTPNGTLRRTEANGKTKRFIPEEEPPMLIDFNDNRTADKTPRVKPTTYVRFVNGGKRLEFMDSNGASPNLVVDTVKKKRGRKEKG